MRSSTGSPVSEGRCGGRPGEVFGGTRVEKSSLSSVVEPSSVDSASGLSPAEPGIHAL